MKIECGFVETMEGVLNRSTGKQSIRHSFFVTGSKLLIFTILSLVYEILVVSSSEKIHNDLGIFLKIISNKLISVGTISIISVCIMNFWKSYKK